MVVQSQNRLTSGVAKVGLLINPLGGQARKRNKMIKPVIAKFPSTLVYEATDIPTFHASVDALIKVQIDLLVIVGGDGTVQAALNYLFARLPQNKWPILAIVPGGTTNMTSLDLGVRGKPEKVLQRLYDFLREPVDPILTQRSVLCIEQKGAAKVYGMFFAVGLVARGVKFSRSSVKQMGITGGIFTILIMLRSLMGMLLGRHQDEWAPVNMSMIKADGTTTHQGTYLFALVSALDCLLLNIRPYWGKEQAPLHVTLVDQQRKRLWHALWPLLTGRGHVLKEQNGYYSYNTHTLAFHMDDEYIVDGEMYRSISQHEPLRISATDPVTFLVI